MSSPPRSGAPGQPARGCIGLLLAAGSGQRFLASRPPGAPARHKLLAPLPDGCPVALTSARALRAALPEVLAVAAPEPAALHQRLREAGCEVTIAADAADGMGASLAHAARLLARHPRTPPWRHVLIALADMPWIHPQTLRRLVHEDTTALIVAPRFQGRRGHPVRLDASLLGELALCEGDQGARGLLARHPVRLIDVDDPGVLADIDTWQDLHPAPGDAPAARDGA